MEVIETQEGLRLLETRERQVPWRQWGPYLSERQWGTVREDYSASGDAWNAFTHDQARSRAYQSGEDGLAGISDDTQRLCFALALWNGRDPILKERLFGLTNSEGNHGEDVKEYYFYLDSTPTHSYMRYLYKYPQRAYPYDDLVQTNRRRGRRDPEYELLDTGAFDDDRYFDVFVTYAKTSPTDLLIEIEVANRGPEAAEIDVLPTLWFRHVWSEEAARPSLQGVDDLSFPMIISRHAGLGAYRLTVDGPATLLFTENETNRERLFGQPNSSPYVKDAFDAYLVHGRSEAVNPALMGTKAAAQVHLRVPAGQSQTVRLGLTQFAERAADEAQDGADGRSGVSDARYLFGQTFTDTLLARREEADAFYDAIMPATLDPDARNVMRQAWAGMLWSKQFYAYDVTRWLGGRGVDEEVPAPGRSSDRNRSWFHMVNEDVISMPDKWEYPWYAAWDLAFHCIALQAVDPDFAKEQLLLMLHPNYLHPNGQIPAYEWNFSDVNPPVHAWAAWYLYREEKEQTGRGDRSFLEACFQKLLMNFTWWVNRKDRTGANIFEGGFLGMDNIGVFDRSASLPGGGALEQADGTAWMAFYAQMMLRIAIELAPRDPAYDQMAAKFFEHVLWIVAAMDKVGERNDELWDEQDGFLYDVLRFPSGEAARLKVRSMVGLLAVCACIVVDEDLLASVPNLVARGQWLREHRPELVRDIPTLQPNNHGERMLATLNERKLRRVLTRMLDETEFLSPHGIRSVSRYHLEHPYIYRFGQDEYRVDYEPAESSTGLFGGNSNWRGPIWMPVNALLIRGLVTLHDYYGDDFTIECPSGSGQQMNLGQVAVELSHRLASVFLRDVTGRRPVYGSTEKFQSDPHWRDYLLFYEYFHGDNGAGIGASHQTGWTGAVAELIRLMGTASVAQPVTTAKERSTP